MSAAAEDSVVEFTVKDTGEGIAKQFQPRVFERFFRAPGQASGGVGLGLAIAKEIVLAHGGKIQVESEEGKGAAFRFTLPQDGIAKEFEK